MDNKDKFISLYVEFEELTRNNEINNKNQNNPEFWRIVEDLNKKRISPYYECFEFLNFCRIYRNKITHEKKESIYLSFSDDFINKFAEIVNLVKSPNSVYSKSTKNVFGVDVDDNVKEKMTIMIKNNYTHVPVYEGNDLIGVFSESSLFHYLYKDEIVEISNTTKFGDIKRYIDFENSKELIRFVKRNDRYDQVVNSFIKEFEKGEKLSCIMITQNGLNTEKVIGIITVWDVIGRRNSG